MNYLYVDFFLLIFLLWKGVCGFFSIFCGLCLSRVSHVLCGFLSIVFNHKFVVKMSSTAKVLNGNNNKKLYNVCLTNTIEYQISYDLHMIIKKILKNNETYYDNSGKYFCWLVVVKNIFLIKILNCFRCRSWFCFEFISYSALQGTSCVIVFSP